MLWSVVRNHDGTHPRAAPLAHLMFMVLHWAVVGLGNGAFGSFQSKKKDWDKH